jgi:hypothetical protein
VWPRDRERAPGHPEVAVGGARDRLDFDASRDRLEERGELKQDAPASGVQPTAHLQRDVFQRRGFGDELHLLVMLDVEEVRRAQVLIPLAVAGLEAVSFNRQLDGRLGLKVERPFVGLESALDRDQPQKCGTRNSTLERAASSRQAPVTRSLTEGVDGAASEVIVLFLPWLVDVQAGTPARANSASIAA